MLTIVLKADFIRRNDVLLRSVNLYLQHDVPVDDQAMSTRIRNFFFFRKYFFADAKIFASTRSVFESFSAVHTYPLVSGNFLICSSAQF